jgi:DHA2 family multidrug resistance protein
MNAAHLSANSLGGLQALNRVITNQATMIAYIDDFRLMMVLTLVTIPFLFIIKKVRPSAGSHAVLE